MNYSPNSGFAPLVGTMALPRSGTHPHAGSSLFNWCLAAILIVGFIIVVADGVSRPVVLEEDWVSSEAMTYEPYYGAFVFGLVMLPLMLAYRSATRISLNETILLWFVMCTVAYAKDFSYMGIPGAPVFVTDIVLGGLGFALLGSLRSGFRSLGRVPKLALIWLLISGLFCAGRGLLSGQDKVLVLRDSAIVVYSMFILISFIVISSWSAVRRLFLFFALGALFATFNAMAWFALQPGQRRYISYGPYILGALLGACVLTAGRWIRPAFGWLVSGVLGIGVILANARTIYVALAFILAIMILLGPTAKLRISRRTVRLSAGAVMVSVLLVWAVMQTRTGAEMVNMAMTDLQSGIVNYADDPNAGFRFLAWLEAGQRFVQSPLIGEGFGVPFSFELTSYDVRPHNTFLTILYKMGLLGFVPLATLLVSFHWRAWTSLRLFHGHSGSLLLYALLLVQLSASFFGLLNLMLESPFLASIFWVIVGVGLRIVDLLHSAPQKSLSFPVPRIQQRSVGL